MKIYFVMAFSNILFIEKLECLHCRQLFKTTERSQKVSYVSS